MATTNEFNKEDLDGASLKKTYKMFMAQVAIVKDDTKKAYEGNKAAGTRARKALGNLNHINKALRARILEQR